MLRGDTRTNRVQVVVEYYTEDAKKRERKRLFILSALDQLSSSGIQYYAIVHNKDQNTDGTLKREHIHLVLDSAVRRRGTTWINLLSDLFQVEVFAIQLQTCDSLEGAIQYLIHKNDANKYQYDPTNIITNVKEDRLSAILEVDLQNTTLTFDMLEDLYLQTNGNVYEMMRVIGLSRYNTFRNVINDFYRFGVPYIEERKRKAIQDEINKEAYKTL